MHVLYPGGFDLLHRAHVEALHTARRLASTGGTLTVGVNSDRLMRHYKREPRHAQNQRVFDVMELGIADHVIVWDGPEGQADQILNAQPDVYIAGTDWLHKDLAAQLDIESLGWFDDNHISLLFLRRTPGISTSQLIEQIEHGQV